jgi:hypothetical protein
VSYLLTPCSLKYSWSCPSDPYTCCHMFTERYTTGNTRTWILFVMYVFGEMNFDSKNSLHLLIPHCNLDVVYSWRHIEVWTPTSYFFPCVYPVFLISHVEQLWEYSLVGWLVKGNELTSFNEILCSVFANSVFFCVLFFSFAITVLIYDF